MTALLLELLNGPEQGTVRRLGGISIIGRDPACNLVVADPVVSRQHAVIRPEDGGGFVIEDLDSRSGTLVNGVRTRKAVLLDGDTIQVGPLALRVRTADRAAGEVPTDEVEVVRSRHQPTMRLSLDVVKFRTAAQGSSAAAATPAADPPAPGEPSEPPPAAPDAARKLELLAEVAASLAAVPERGRLTRETAARIVALFPAVRRIGFFELIEVEGEEQVLRPAYLLDRSRRAEGEPVRVSEAVLQAAIRERQAVLSEDVQVDPRFRRSQTLHVAGVCSMICAPLCVGERVLGALYVDTTDPRTRFDGAALRLLSAIAAVVAAAFENARLFARFQTESVRRASLERYFSPDLVERVLRGDLPLAREGRLAHGTILFVDVRGFSRLTLSTAPPALVATLNAYFAAMQRIVFRSRGTVERFGGDSILAYWGVVDADPEGPARSVRAALAMQVEVVRLGAELAAAERPRLEVGIGLNTGEVIAGDVGSAERYEFTILGDAANMARRFETLAGAWEVVAGAATIRAVGGRVLHVPLPPTVVKGKDEPVEVSLVYGLRVDAGDGPERRYELALRCALALGEGEAEETLASALTLSSGGVTLEVLTPHDPEPDTPARLALGLPRQPRACTLSGRVLSNVIQETVQLGPTLAVTGSAVQRIALQLDDPRPLLELLRSAGSSPGA